MDDRSDPQPENLKHESTGSFLRSVTHDNSLITISTSFICFSACVFHPVYIACMLSSCFTLCIYFVYSIFTCHEFVYVALPYVCAYTATFGVFSRPTFIAFECFSCLAFSVIAHFGFMSQICTVCWIYANILHIENMFASVFCTALLFKCIEFTTKQRNLPVQYSAFLTKTVSKL